MNKMLLLLLLLRKLQLSLPLQRVYDILVDECFPVAVFHVDRARAGVDIDERERERVRESRRVSQRREERLGRDFCTDLTMIVAPKMRINGSANNNP